MNTHEITETIMHVVFCSWSRLRTRHAILMMAFSLMAFAKPTYPAGFLDVCREKLDEADKAQTMTAPGADGWFFLADELRHLTAGRFWGDYAAGASRTSRPDRADPLPAILDFDRQLKSAGIRLIVLPVPAKAAIYPDSLAEKIEPVPGLAAANREFFEILRAAGVEVLDMTGIMLDHRVDGMFCKTDSHWSGKAVVLAAQTLAGMLQIESDEPRRDYRAEIRPATFSGDLVRGKGISETIPLRFVTDADGGPVRPCRESPVVLMGDSHALVFHAGRDMLAAGAGLADQMAMELGRPVDLVGVRGSGATPARINLMRLARADSGYLERKRVIVWCFSAREFTQSSGWSKVPLPLCGSRLDDKEQQAAD